MSEPPAPTPPETPPAAATGEPEQAAAPAEPAAAAETAAPAPADTSSSAPAAAPAPTPPPPAPAGIERRASDRRPMRTQAVVVLPGPREFAVRTVDISATGMGIVAAANPAAGTAFTIRFVMPSKTKAPAEVHEASARVVHSVFSSDEDGFKIGLLFTRLTPACAAAIVQYIGEATVR